MWTLVFLTFTGSYSNYLTFASGITRPFYNFYGGSKLSRIMINPYFEFLTPFTGEMRPETLLESCFSWCSMSLHSSLRTLFLSKKGSIVVQPASALAKVTERDRGGGGNLRNCLTPTRFVLALLYFFISCTLKPMAESSHPACPASPLKLVKSSSVKAVESINKENTKQPRPILARHTGAKPRERKSTRWAPDVVDPCTNKDQYWRKRLFFWRAQNKFVEQEVSSYEEKENETSDNNSISGPLEFVESSSVEAVEIIKKEDSNKLRSILARPTGEKPREKKRLRWAPDVVDPCTNKDEYWRKPLLAWLTQNELEEKNETLDKFVEQEVFSCEERKNETSHKLVEQEVSSSVEKKSETSDKLVEQQVSSSEEKKNETSDKLVEQEVSSSVEKKNETSDKFVEHEVSSAQEKKNETSDKNSNSETESSSLEAVEIVKKEYSNPLRSILLFPTGGKPREKKRVRWAPYVVDPCTNKDEYLQKHLARYFLNSLAAEEISSSEDEEAE